MARIATAEQARGPCPCSPFTNRAHEWHPVPQHIASRFAEPPLFYCVYDLLFLTEATMDKVGLR